ncbi:MAG TPA: alkaline phosphatase family protein [Planctomycetota bacterium]|nr:alkaline phosphatase family protein [Planctomycetota bacterium]
MKAGQALLLLLASGCAASRSSVVLVTIDGTRWQEIFGGADLGLLENKKETGEVQATRKAFWRDSVEERRRALAPFLWGTVATEGRLLGNVDAGSQILVTNRFKISYPGYHELLCGFASETIDSNSKVPNPDVTVLEWLSRRPGFRDRVAAFCSWDVFPSILNRERCGFPIDIGEPKPEATLLGRLSREIPAPWHGSIYDAFVFHGAMAYLREKTPRVFYLAFGDTDEWAHSGWYDHYLESIHREDAWLGELWRTLQSMPEYAGTTTLLITCDHGRGDNPGEWRSHNSKVNGAGYIWIGAIGPRIAPLGEASEQEPLLQGQVAATVAAAVGEDFAGENPNAAPPLPILLPAGR